MSRTRFLARLIVVLLSVAAGARPSVRGEGAPDDERAFLTALEQVKVHLSAGRAEAGLKLVAATLEKHPRKAYVRAKRADLEDVVRRLAFRTECPPPDPQEVVKGKLKRFVSKSGELDIRYERGAPDDFENESGMLVFPARFRGPYTISIKGPSYATTAEQSPSVRVGMETDPKSDVRRSYGVDFGIPPYDERGRVHWVPFRIVQWIDKERKVLVEKETSPANPRKPFRCEVIVGATRITATLDGAALGGVTKAQGVFGYAAIEAPGWSEIGISGIIEPSWIQSRIDKIVDGKRAGFDARFDAKSRLPAWLYEAAPAPEALPPGASLNAEVPAEFARAFAEAAQLVELDDLEGAAAGAEALRARGAPERLVLLLLARIRLARGEATEALADVEKVIAADKTSLLALLLKVEILLELGRDEDFTTALKAATASPDATANIFESAATYALLAGRPDDARSLAEEAARRGLRSSRLEGIGRVIVRAQNGPDWPKSYEFKSANYHVVSDLDMETCRAATEVLEESLVAYRVRIRPLKVTARKLYKVYLFSGRAGFQRYVDDSSVFGRSKMENAAGIYSPVLKQLLIWNLPTREEMIVTIRHEGFHQYLDRLLPDPPVWFNEGMAVYYEEARRIQGEFKTDHVRRDFLKELEGRPLVPMAEYLAIRPKAFYAAGNASYAQGWLVVHLLQHGKPRHRDLFKAFLSKLETLSGAEATRLVFDPSSLATLDQELEAYRVELTARK